MCGLPRLHSSSSHEYSAHPFQQPSQAFSRQQFAARTSPCTHRPDQAASLMPTSASVGSSSRTSMRMQCAEQKQHCSETRVGFTSIGHETNLRLTYLCSSCREMAWTTNQAPEPVQHQQSLFHTQGLLTALSPQPRAMSPRPKLKAQGGSFCSLKQSS